MTYSIVDPNLYLIPLDQEMIGFRNFISAWLYKSEEVTLLVDPGPKCSINKLKNVLEKMKVKQIDYILLTHIHIDHAGGAGAILDHFPEAKVICHPKAIEHLISPKKLWHGSLKVLGSIAESYGEIIPIPANKIAYLKKIETKAGKIIVIETPGHAAHHLCFQFRHYLFAGEVIGVTHCLKEGTYTRPATPPVFKLETSLDAIDRVIPIDVSMICFGHYGFRTDIKEALMEAQEQLLVWVDIVEHHLQEGEDTFTDRTIAALKKEDAAFANIKYLPEDIRQRELYFIGNSLNGIKDYLLRIG